MIRYILYKRISASSCIIDKKGNVYPYYGTAWIHVEDIENYVYEFKEAEKETLSHVLVYNKNLNSKRTLLLRFFFAFSKNYGFYWEGKNDERIIKIFVQEDAKDKIIKREVLLGQESKNFFPVNKKEVLDYFGIIQNPESYISQTESWRSTKTPGHYPARGGAYKG